ncbi:MAG: hypothetical protein QM756_17315 [Polyangiaceae bacterium]
MANHPLAGKPAPAELLIDESRLVAAYYSERPDPAESEQRVSFGTSGHRGSPLARAFNEAHILAITQAICEYRKQAGTEGPLFLGKDTHAASAPAERTALEVLAANGVETLMQANDGFTPTPAVSHAVLSYNRGRTTGLADGVLVTPSHNPPEDGGFKYNPPNGGPADTNVTRLGSGSRQSVARRWLPRREARQLRTGAQGVHYARVGSRRGLHQRSRQRDRSGSDQATRKCKIGVDPLGGASVHYWPVIAERWGLDLEVVNPAVDPRFGFMTVDHDGKIRMDCSSPFAMAKLVGLKDRYDVAFGNDPDADRHGIVSSSLGLLNPNHYLAVAISYLFTNRPELELRCARG